MVLHIIDGMARRGRCRCGEVLTFRRGPDGYKCRCPSCGAVVRLRRRGQRQRTPRQRLRCACGTIVLVGKYTPEQCPSCRRPLTGATPAPAAAAPAPGSAPGAASVSPRGMIVAPGVHPSGTLRTRWLWLAIAGLAAVVAAAGIAALLLLKQ